MFQVNMNELVFNLWNLDSALKDRWALFEVQLTNLERSMASIQEELVALRRELANLSQPLIYVEYMELDTAVHGSKKARVVVDNLDTQGGVKEEMGAADIYSEKYMETKTVSGLT